jgi:hypothetical protein
MLLLCLRRRAQCLTRTLACPAADLRPQCLRPDSVDFQHGVAALAALAIRCQSSNVVPLRKQLKDEAKAKKAASSNKAGRKTKLEESNQHLKDWELTVGIEIHAQLNTACKLFSCMCRRLTYIPVLMVYSSSIHLYQCAT